MSAFFSTGMTKSQFLEQYWQKKPLLIRRAFVDFESPVTPDEFAGLACEPEIESRLIEEKGQAGSWQVTNGPLSETILSQLPESHWTMLIQDVDKHLPELQYLLDPFRFIPEWRRDDLMISYASPHGSVGPHTDGYDVFLLQAMGHRRWQIGTEPVQQAKLIEGLELQILAEFEPGQTWDLAPGDILYLPPHFAHHGIALDECMTFSIGFRAPAQVDLLDSLVNNLLENQLGTARYRDADLMPAKSTTEIDSQALTKVRAMLHQAIEDAEPVIALSLGRFVTETKPDLRELAAEYESDRFTEIEIDTEFGKGGRLQRNPYGRFAWTKIETGAVLFMAGEAYPVGNAAAELLPLLAEKKELTQQHWLKLKISDELVSLLITLIEAGGWFWLAE